MYVDAQTVIGETGYDCDCWSQPKRLNVPFRKERIVTIMPNFRRSVQLKITSIKLEGNIIPVDITIYDLDGQQGLYVPYSPGNERPYRNGGNMS